MNGITGMDLSKWVGREEVRSDLIAEWPARALAAMLDASDVAVEEGARLPAGWQWLYFLEARPPSAMGLDGHPARGGFLPPVTLPRRMWAGGRIRFESPLCIGDRAQRQSTILDVRTKSGRSGELVFVTVRHDLSVNGRLAISEEQDLVYREAASAGSQVPAGQPAPADAAWRQAWRADPVMLFRYSALTFNAHRIHYDRPYATGEEHYRGLVVHGPLQATLLLELARRHAGRPVKTFEYRALQPVFDGEGFFANGQPGDSGAELWTSNESGSICMQATAGF